MIRWDKGVVAQIVRTTAGMQEVRVRMRSGAEALAIHYTDELPPLAIGDEVQLNTTAVELGLGTGGYHFVHAVFRSAAEAAEIGAGAESPSFAAAPEAAEAKTAGGSRAAVRPQRAVSLQAREAERPAARHSGHLMKLRYTPQQRAVLAAEEPASPHHALLRERRTLDGMPVLIGDVHSILPAAVAWLRCACRRHGAAYALPSPEAALPVGEPPHSPRIVYAMGDGGALPLAFSRHAAALKELGWLQGTVTYGHAFGGDLETVNKFTALLAARHALAADIAIAVMGPGIAGTGTPLGHTGIEAGELVNAAAALGGRPIVVPRVSFAEPRARHRGVSHHTLAALGTAALARAFLPMPGALPAAERRQLERQLNASGIAWRHDIRWMPSPALAEVEDCLAAYPLPVTTMGRSCRDDPAFFISVCAAAQLAWQLWREPADSQR